MITSPAAATVDWLFNLPSASSYSGSYPLVATLSLAQTDDGVQFTLTPNWGGTDTGYAASSHVEQLDYVFDNPGSPLTNFTPTYPATLSNASFRWDGGAPIKTFVYDTGVNMDSGYKADDQHLKIGFFTKNNDPDAYRFDVTFPNSMWTVLGTQLADFTGTQATPDSNKPTPIQGIISVSAYSLEGFNPTPSNWVTGPTGGSVTPGSGTTPSSGLVPPDPVPEPGTLSLLGAAILGGLFAYRRRRQAYA